ncbi:NUDIX domain-containing protein [Micromonospora sp. WMMD1082]|uniref:NUDIX domain-containing protein n=1 Tax=Micromonospora sp. WMMD1082 TaxID=3016104 RepID=UPI0024172B13|nr:NUDIX domain-containing protein [Micromonospora sp. WMMD1082]MDG4793022.1 NUDIX domain-containing protein [Micromonospora sp. WMMD1082]
MAQRQRAAAVIVRDGRVPMVRERGRGPSGRHDGQEYWTLPGGGIGIGETAEDAVRREVVEEVGLQPVAVRYLLDVPYPSGLTACFAVQVAGGEPRLGDDGLSCDCSVMVGVDWVPLPQLPTETPGLPIATMIIVWEPPITS